MASTAGAGGGRGDVTVQFTTVDGAPLDELQYTNTADGTFRWVPDRFRLQLDPPAAEWATDTVLQLVLPPGWRALPSGERVWLVFPAGRPAFPVVVRVLSRVGARWREVAARSVPVAFCGRNRFDPRRDRLPWANRVDELGEVEPEERHFRATFRLAVAPRAFFRGLYREVVGLRQLPDGGVRGGLCTGLARVALARALGSLEGSAALRDAVLVLHGRQLSDRALLAGLPWFLFPSPRRAYRAFVDDLLVRGRSERCYDVNVPRPWRRDVVQALLGQGHTVVPYAFCQREATQAVVWVYDPNLPDRPDLTAITFDLRHDRYAYPPLAVDGARTTVVAVPLAAYLRGRTAVLASLGNLVLMLWRDRRQRRSALGAVSLLAAGLLWRFWKRASGRKGTGRSRARHKSATRGAVRSVAAGAASASRR